MPAWISADTPFFLSTSPLKSISPTEASMPNSLLFLIRLSRSPAYSQTLLGMHPLFTQVPPVSALSASTTFASNCAARIAAAYPPEPPPIIITSYIQSPHCIRIDGLLALRDLVIDMFCLYFYASSSKGCAK